MRNQNDNGQELTSTEVLFLDSAHKDDLTYFDRSNLESGGYSEHTTFIVDIKLDIKYYDFSKNIPNYTDFIINIEDTKFYVNKEILCTESGFFRNKFVVENCDEKEWTMKFEKKDDVRCFLASLCFSFETVNDDNYKELIRLAVEYETPRLHKSCEKFLISKVSFQLDEMVGYADKLDYNELMKTCFDYLTKPAQIEKIQKSKKYTELKDTTKRTIGKKLLEILSESHKKENEQKEKLKCQNCGTVDLVQNFNICQTCNERNLKNFENEEEVLKIAICSTCAVKNHIRQKHVIIEFLSFFLDYKLENLAFGKFERINNIRKGEEQTWKTLSEIAEMKINELIKLKNQSKLTKKPQDMDEINNFIETTKTQNERYIEIMRAQTLMLQENLRKMEKLVKEIRKNE